MIDTLAVWHDIVCRRDLAGLPALLSDDVVFHSPVVHAPQRGKTVTVLYLTGAMHVLNNGQFTYVRQIAGAREALLEFSTEIEGIHINGVDLIHWGDDGRIDDIKVMVRPLKAVNLLHQKMAELLQRMG